MRTLLLLGCLALASCAPQFSLFGGGPRPLSEQKLSGGSGDKVLVVSVRGFISSEPRQGLLGESESLVQRVASRLRRAAQDEEVKALILAVDSPGGTVTDSAVIYHEIERFKKQRNATVVACMLNVAASGGYMVSLAADRIVAHPSTLTGSIGTIFLRPDVSGLMEMLGLEAEVFKTGRLKDMGSPLRQSTEEERQTLQAIIEEQNGRFLALVRERRGLTAEQVAAVADARIMTAGQALEAGLVDELGYMDRAEELARELVGLPADAPVTTYRREGYPDDTPYNAVGAGPGDIRPRWPAQALALDAVTGALPRAGLYWLWAPEYWP